MEPKWTPDVKMIPLVGPTYPVRVQLRGLGGVYDKDRKLWLIPENNIDLARMVLATVKRVREQVHGKSDKKVLFAPKD